jgi:hypothetical protein
MRKYLRHKTVVLVVVVLAVMLAGCGGDDSGTPIPAATPIPIATPTPDAALVAWVESLCAIDAEQLPVIRSLINIAGLPVEEGKAGAATNMRNLISAFAEAQSKIRDLVVPESAGQLHAAYLTYIEDQQRLYEALLPGVEAAATTADLQRGMAEHAARRYQIDFTYRRTASRVPAELRTAFSAVPSCVVLWH